MKKIWLVACGVGGLALAAHAGKLLFDAGVFWKEEPRGFVDCTERARITGAEDLEWSAGLKTIIISSDHRPGAGAETPPSGAIYGLDPASKAPPTRLSPDLSFPFHPHGIALWETKAGPVLFAINHRPDESTVEVFQWDGKKFRFEETLRDPLLITPNDLVATGPREFYLSHDHGSRSHFMQAIEHYARFGRGYLTRYDGKTFTRVASRIFFANGLALDRAKNLLYVAAMLEKAVRVYDVKDEEHPAYLRSITLPAGPDNVQLAEDGSLWIGAHPKILTLKKHSEHHELPAPTMVIRVTKPESADATAETVMVNDGKLISASSVALPRGGRVFLGSIYDEKVLDCARP